MPTLHTFYQYTNINESLTSIPLYPTVSLWILNLQPTSTIIINSLITAWILRECDIKRLRYTANCFGLSAVCIWESKSHATGASLWISSI